jgi:hypothetical protein
LVKKKSHSFTQNATEKDDNSSHFVRKRGLLADCGHKKSGPIGTASKQAKNCYYEIMLCDSTWYARLDSMVCMARGGNVALSQGLPPYRYNSTNMRIHAASIKMVAKINITV